MNQEEVLYWGSCPNLGPILLVNWLPLPLCGSKTRPLIARPESGETEAGWFVFSEDLAEILSILECIKAKMLLRLLFLVHRHRCGLVSQRLLLQHSFLEGIWFWLFPHCAGFGTPLQYDAMSTQFLVYWRWLEDVVQWILLRPVFFVLLKNTYFRGPVWWPSG